MERIFVLVLLAQRRDQTLMLTVKHDLLTCRSAEMNFSSVVILVQGAEAEVRQTCPTF